MNTHLSSEIYNHITDNTLTKNLRIVNKRFKNRIKHLKIVKILINCRESFTFRRNFAYYCSLDWHGYRDGCCYWRDNQFH